MKKNDTMKKRGRPKIISLPEKELLRVDEVAQYFDVTAKTVYLWIAHKHLAIEKTPGGQLRVTRESVDKCRFQRKNNGK